MRLNIGILLLKEMEGNRFHNFFTNESFLKAQSKNFFGQSA